MGDLGTVVAIFDNIIALGTKIWGLIAANKPVANVSTNSISFLPSQATAWDQMASWQGPAVKAVRLEFTNGLGMKVVDFVYRVSYNYAGNYAGKGQYIAHMTVIPEFVDVSWGYTFNANVDMGNVVNTGTVEQPVPGAYMQVKWKNDTVVKHLEGVDAFFVKGNGQAMHVTGD